MNNSERPHTSSDLTLSWEVSWSLIIMKLPCFIKMPLLVSKVFFYSAYTSSSKTGKNMCVYIQSAVFWRMKHRSLYWTAPCYDWGMESCGPVAHNHTHWTSVLLSLDQVTPEGWNHLHWETGRDGEEKILPGFLGFMLSFKRDNF